MSGCASKPLCEPTQKDEIERASRDLQGIGGIRKILWSAGERLHGNEVFPTDNSQGLTLECNLNRPGEGGVFDPPQADEQVDAISKLVSQLQQRADGIICVTAPELRLKASRLEGAFETRQGGNRQGEQGVCIQACAHDPMNGSRHCADEGIPDALAPQYRDGVKHQ
jgi:hypothetical protein